MAHKRLGRHLRAPREPVALLALVLLVILVATLMPSLSDSGHLPECLLCGDALVSDAIANVVLYLPLGAAATLMGWRWSRVLLGGAILSATVELAQVFIAGRHGTPLDVLANIVGVAAGVALVASSRWWLRPPAARADRLSLLAVAFALTVFGLTGLLLRPALPHATYYGQWTGDFFGFEHYEGQVIEASIGQLEMPSQALETSDSVRALLLAGARLRVLVVVGPPPPGLAPIFSIADDQQRGVALLGADGDDLVFSFRRRAAALRMYRPDLRALGALADVTVADTISIAVNREAKRYCAIVDETSTCMAPPTIGLGWAFLTYAPKFGPWLGMGLSAVWVAALVLPFGFWARWGWVSGLGWVLLASGLVFLPTVMELGPSRAVEYAGAVVGFGAGLVVRWLVRRVSKTIL